MNYEDPNYAVGLPVFCIHGNHDDPSREGATEVGVGSVDVGSCVSVHMSWAMHSSSLPRPPLHNQNQPLSALDLLSINNLVNYFGKTEASDNVEVRASGRGVIRIVGRQGHACLSACLSVCLIAPSSQCQPPR